MSARSLSALELRRAGVSLPKIVSELGFDSVSEAATEIADAIAELGTPVDVVEVRDLELARLEKLQQAVWVKASKGDLPSIDRAMRLGEMRMRIAGVISDDQSPIAEAFDLSVKALAVGDVDEALVVAGRRLAARIDAARRSIDPLAETKALYLIPHLVGILRELGATPAVRNEIVAAAAAPVEQSSDVARFDDFKRRKKPKGA